MKISDRFDARRLRPKGGGNWRWRLCAGFSALLVIAGVMLALAASASLVSRPAALSELNTSPAGSLTVLLAGLLVAWFGVWLWRRCRRRERGSQDLRLSRHLLKKRE
jgi:uncharacterized membrane protein